jgi:DNA-binding MurR/RpiR family transcriptional regulator
MTYEDRIRRERAKMSKSFGKLADYLLDSYVESAFMTASELAHVLDLDAATVVRFSQHLGYTGFPPLQREIRTRVKENLLVHPEEAKVPDSIPGVATEALAEVSHAMDRTRLSLDAPSIAKLVEQIGSARRISVIPEGPAQPTAYSLVLFLEQGGFPVYIARTGIVDLARTINISNQQDLLIAMEVSGQLPYIAQTLKEAQKRGIPTASIVGSASFPSARYADSVVAAQTHTSTGLGIVSVEALVYAIGKVLYWRFADRFAGTEQSIEELSEKIQVKHE